jgi:hypothetical protein
MLLEFSYRHVANTLDDGQALAAHRTGEANTAITLADVQLAAHNALMHSFTEPLGGAELDALIKPLNQTPLPVAPQRTALQVAPEATMLNAAYTILRPERAAAATGASAAEKAQTAAAASTPAAGIAPVELPVAVPKRKRFIAEFGSDEVDPR